MSTRKLTNLQKIQNQQYQILSIVDETVHAYQLIIVYLSSSGCSMKEVKNEIEQILKPNISIIIGGKDFKTRLELSYLECLDF